MVDRWYEQGHSGLENSGKEKKKEQIPLGGGPFQEVYFFCFDFHLL
jgi:hypothetical protein